MNTEEYLDLVDKNDNLLGSITRSEAHLDPNLIHREVGIIICNEQNKVLLQKRSLTKRTDPGIWTISCAGHVTHGLTPLETAHKELMEELGFDTDLEFFEKEFSELPTESRFFYWYTGQFPEDSKITMEKGQVDGVKFISKFELEDFQKAGNEIGKHSLRYLQKFWSKV